MRIMTSEEWKLSGIIMLWAVLTLIGITALAFYNFSNNSFTFGIVVFYVMMGAVGIMSIGKWIIDTW